MIEVHKDKNKTDRLCGPFYSTYKLH